MKMNPYLKTAIFPGIFFLITYALAQGMRYGNALGIVLALGSMFALGVCIHLTRKFAQMEEEER